MNHFLPFFLVISAVVFTLGVITVLVRKNPLIIFMGVEMMLNAVNLTFVSFSRFTQDIEGQVAVFLVIAVAAVEVAIGLAIIVGLFRYKRKIDVDKVNILQG